MTKKFICFLLLSLPIAASGQAFNVDSLKKAAAGSQANKERINALKQLADYYSSANTDSCFYYSELLKATAIDAKDRSAEAYALGDIGIAFENRGNFGRALSLNLQALEIFKEIKDSANIADTYLSIGGIYQSQKNNKLTYKYYNSARVLAAKVKDNKDLYLASLELGDVFFYNNKLDSAIFYTRLAYNMEKNKTTNYPLIVGHSAASLANEYIRLGNSGAAASILKEAIADAAIHDKQHLYVSQLAYSNYLLTTGQPDSALIYANKVQERLRDSPELFIAVSIYPLLAKIYELKKQYQPAYYYQAKSIKANDSLASMNQAREVSNITFNEQQRQTDLKNAAIAYQNKLKLYGVLLVLIIVITISLILWRANKRELAVIALLRRQQEELKATQTQLIQSEKMASLGELTAGIAHEIQNPLNFVNNFSDVNREMIDELRDELKSGNLDEALAIAGDIKQNEEKINQHGKRADGIVKGMLQHSRSSSAIKEPTDINKLADEYLRLSYHGLRAKDKNFNAELITNFEPGLPKVNAIPQDIGRVLLNLFNNAFYAVNQKSKTAGPDYKPTVEVSTSSPPLTSGGGGLVITVKDNGTGIPDSIKEKIMQPFFTTKPTGEGTGLGLSLTYDMVVKGHGGKISVESKEGEGSQFAIELPVS